MFLEFLSQESMKHSNKQSLEQCTQTSTFTHKINKRSVFAAFEAATFILTKSD